MILLLLSIFSLINFEQNDTYPYYAEKIQNFKGSKIYLEDNSGSKVFQLKPNWMEESKVLFVWDGLIKKNPKGIDIGNEYVIDADNCGDNFITLSNSNNESFITIYDNLLNKRDMINYKTFINVAKERTHFIASNSNCLYLLHNFDFVKICPKKKLLLQNIGSNIDTAIIVKLSKAVKGIITVEKNNKKGMINFLNTNNKQYASSRIELFDKYKIFPIKDFIVVAAMNNGTEHTLLQYISKYTGKIHNLKWINADLNRIVSSEKNNFIYYFNIKSNNLIFSKYNYKNLYDEIINQIEIPKDLSKLQICKQISEKIVILFENGFMYMDNTGDLISINIFDEEIELNQNLEVFVIDKYLIFSSDINSLIFEIKKNQFWLLKFIIHKTWNYLLSIFLFLSLILSIQKLAKRKRMLNEILNLPSAGIIFFFDASDKLINANDEGKLLLGISSNIIKPEPINIYFISENLIEFKNLIEKGLKTKLQQSEKITLKHEGLQKEMLGTISIMRNFAGLYKGLVFTAIDITEQLEKKRMANWAQLAHDMQTNLSTIRLNAENLVVTDSDNLIRKQKILHQNNLLIKRVRDIVTVGRQDKLNLTKCDAFDICVEARMEFDDFMFPNIKFEFKSEHFFLICDKQRMIRAVRNAIENSIKAIKENPGLIILKCYKEGMFFIFTIKDNGPGMDEVIIKKMTEPYFTTAEGKGGFGIGTMIIQKVIEQHNGQLQIESQVGKGTEIIIKIPHLKITEN